MGNSQEWGLVGSLIFSDVNKDWIPKDKGKDKDLPRVA